MNEKKPKDFAVSAENLCNPPALGDKLEELNKLKEEISQYEAALETIPTYNLLLSKSADVQRVTTEIKAMIDELGSYQDIHIQRYAVKYRSIHKEYHADKLKANFPKFVELCIIDSVNIPALEGQIKGKLITEEELANAGVITYNTRYSYYVR